MYTGSAGKVEESLELIHRAEELKRKEAAIPAAVAVAAVVAGQVKEFYLVVRPMSNFFFQPYLRNWQFPLRRNNKNFECVTYVEHF